MSMSRGACGIGVLGGSCGCGGGVLGVGAGCGGGVLGVRCRLWWRAESDGVGGLQAQGGACLGTGRTAVTGVRVGDQKLGVRRTGRDS